MTSIVPNENDSFGVSTTKSLVLSTVTTTGVLLGFVVVGYTVTVVERLKKNRQAKKEAKKAE